MLMTYTRFEELPVWREAMRLAHEVYDMIEANEKLFSFSLRDQLERATLSVSNNIAEGFERGTTNELLSFIYIRAWLGGRSAIHALLPGTTPPFPESQISNFKFEIPGRKLLAPASRMGRIFAEYDDQGSPPP